MPSNRIGRNRHMKRNETADESEFILASSDSFSDTDFYSSLQKSHKKQIPQIILQKIARYLEM